MTVTIDGSSGCCHGVKRAIETAEEYLETHPGLYCLGSIVHNAAEMSRLASKGMSVIGAEEFAGLRDATVLIRAHGEPPSTYAIAERNCLKLIDCTCPVVLKLQQRIAAAYADLGDRNGQILIFGKKGHAEVNGLVGQTGGTATVIESASDTDRLLAEGVIDPARPTVIFSQTTRNPEEYGAVTAKLGSVIPDFTAHDTICRQVSSRLTSLIEFAGAHDVIIFVCGSESSNGRILFDHCISANPRSYKVGTAGDIRREWFGPADSVGICGATSTPLRQLEAARRIIADL